MEKVEPRTAKNNGGEPTLYSPQCLASSEEGNFGNHAGKSSIYPEESITY